MDLPQAQDTTMNSETAPQLAIPAAAIAALSALNAEDHQLTWTVHVGPDMSSLLLKWRVKKHKRTKPTSQRWKGTAKLSRCPPTTTEDGKTRTATSPPVPGPKKHKSPSTLRRDLQRGMARKARRAAPTKDSTTPTSPSKAVGTPPPDLPSSKRQRTASVPPKLDQRPFSGPPTLDPKPPDDVTPIRQYLPPPPPAQPVPRTTRRPSRDLGRRAPTPTSEPSTPPPLEPFRKYERDSLPLPYGEHLYPDDDIYIVEGEDSLTDLSQFCGVVSVHRRSIGLVYSCTTNFPHEVRPIQNTLREVTEDYVLLHGPIPGFMLRQVHAVSQAITRRHLRRHRSK